MKFVTALLVILATVEAARVQMEKVNILIIFLTLLTNFNLSTFCNMVIGSC